ncbi:hypothetical protein WA026_000874 [Henosepilachna vigintioctopunctata]|uniref:Uncharacterized protein n=1 Tax=Henosepilachna vigintioctopunctata TaxID=420089 RepID=A0AAW1V8U9_9CUCU
MLNTQIRKYLSDHNDIIIDLLIWTISGLYKNNNFMEYGNLSTPQLNAEKSCKIVKKTDLLRNTPVASKPARKKDVHHNMRNKFDERTCPDWKSRMQENHRFNHRSSIRPTGSAVMSAGGGVFLLLHFKAFNC